MSHEEEGRLILYAIFALIAFGFISMAIEIRSNIIWAWQALDGLRERRHQRELELIDKEIELAEAQGQEVQPEVEQIEAPTK